MAVAGKVAITLSNENDGKWSESVAYDRLVAVTHNNNLYISKKPSTNVEPTVTDEFWFLALKGFSGEDVQTLIDSINNIIDGTTPVGNAKTLDGHGAEYFAPLADLAKYLPLSAKPTGTYTGNGDATERTIATGGTGNFLILYSARGTAILSPTGVITQTSGAVSYLSTAEGKFVNGTLTLTSTSPLLNENGISYIYQVL